MKNLKIRKRKLNNSGMTLIEVMIALSLLTICLMPMLFSFVQVAKFSEKGRLLQQTTTIAQTAMENCKAYNVDAIHAKMTETAHSFLKGDYLTGASWSYEMNGDTRTYFINNMNVDNRKVGMSVELTPVSSTEKDITEYKQVNPYLDAVFVATSTKNDTTNGSPVDADDQKSFVDLETDFFDKALSDLATEITSRMQTEHGGVLNGQSVSKDELRNQYFNITFGAANQNGLKVSRKIEVKASTDTSTGVDKVVVTYTYKVDNIETYKYVYGGTEYPFTMSTSPVKGRTITHSATIYTNAVSKAYAGNLEKIYCYYYPMYNGYTQNSFRCTQDNIVVDTSGLKYFSGGVWKDKSTDVYLLKQLNSAESTTTLDQAEEFNHTGTVTVMCGDTGKINLFHNYKTNLGDPEGTALTWAEGSGLTVANGTCNDIGALTKKETKKLMYQIQIKMYSNPQLNSGVMSGDEILTLDGTKINW